MHHAYLKLVKSIYINMSSNRLSVISYQSFALMGSLDHHGQCSRPPPHIARLTPTVILPLSTPENDLRVCVFVCKVYLSVMLNV